MRNRLPNSRKAHILAIAAAIFLHSSLAAWAMNPTDPAVIPDQQVIQIVMVAPSSPSQAKPEPEVTEAEPTPVVPPKEDGLKKYEPKPEKKVEKKPEQKKIETAAQAAPTPMTSGPQAKDATEKNAAITEPVNAAYLRNPPPIYPRSARRQNIQGKVMLEVSVTPEGAARHVAISRSSGSSILDEAALDAVSNWKFVPARRGSEVVEAKVIVPVEFRLN